MYVSRSTVASLFAANQTVALALGEMVDWPAAAGSAPISAIDPITIEAVRILMITSSISRVRPSSETVQPPTDTRSSCQLYCFHALMKMPAEENLQGFAIRGLHPARLCS
jgi:hypothetical protein